MAQAMSRTPAAIPISTSSGVVSVCRSWERPRAAGSTVTLFSEYCFLVSFDALANSLSARSEVSAARAKGSIATRASSIDVPGASRATTRTQRYSRSSMASQPGVISFFIIIGTKTSLFRPSSNPSKPGWAMPTTVKGCPLMIALLPTTAGSPPKRDCQ